MYVKRYLAYFRAWSRDFDIFGSWIRDQRLLRAAWFAENEVVIPWKGVFKCVIAWRVLVYKKSFLATVQWTPWEIGIISWISLKRLLPQTIFLWVLCEKQSLGVNQNIAMKICLGLVWNNTNYMPIFHTAAISHSCGILIKNDVRHQNL